MTRKHKRTIKGKRRFKLSETLGFAAISLYLALVLYLAFAPSHAPTKKVEVTSSSYEAKTAFDKAAIVDQLGLRHPNQAFISEAKLILGRAGFKVDVYPPEAVTVSLYKTISTEGYRLIVFRAHMGINEEAEDKPVGLFTSEPYSQFGYQLEQLKGWVGSAKAYGTKEALFAVSPKFIREATVMDYPSTVIILSGCLGLYSKTLPQAFLDRGASAVIGWNGLVNVDYVDKATLSLLKALCLKKLNIERAVEAVMREVGPDLEHGSRLGYYPPSISDYRLTAIPKWFSETPSMVGKPSELVWDKLSTTNTGSSKPNP